MSWLNGAISRLLAPRIEQGVVSELEKRGYFPGPGGAGYSAADHYSDIDYAELDANEAAYEVNVFLHRCVTIVAETCAMVPWKLYEWVKRDGDMVREEVTDHPLLDLLDKPSVRSSLYEFKLELFSHVPLSGESFIFVENGTNGARLSGDPKKLQILKPRHVVNVALLQNGEVRDYVYRQDGDEIKIDPEFVTHIKTFNPRNPTRGLSLVEVAQSPVLLDYYLQQHNRNFFKHGANPGFVFSTKERVQSDQVKAMAADFKKDHEGVQNGFKTAWLYGGFEPKSISISAKDGEFLGLGRFSRDQIMVLTGVVPAVVGVSQDLNYATSHDQKVIFYEHTVKPNVHRATDGINNQLIPVWYRDDWQRRGLHLMGDYSGIKALQVDQEVEQRTNVGYVNSGVMSRNEARERINLQPIDDEAFSIPQTPGASPFAGLLGGQPPTVRRIPFVKGTRKPSRLDQWKARDRDFISSERMIERTMITFFADQRDRLLRAIENAPSMELVGTAPGNGHRNRIIRFDAPEIVKFSIDEFLTAWNLDAENAAILGTMLPVLKDILDNAGKAALGEVGADAIFHLDDPRVLKFLKDKEFVLSGINATTTEILQNVVAEGASEGLSVGEIGRRIRDQYNDMATWRAETIARTEAVAGNNFAAVEGYKQSGVVQMKEWLTAPGAANQRHELVPGLDGQQRALDESFDVNGYAMPTPGVGGPASETINCRCTVLPVVED